MKLTAYSSRSISTVIPQYRALNRHDYICTYNGCNTHFTRISDLKRHHEAQHVRQNEYFCRFHGCRRMIRAFKRKDKRNEHEKKIHGMKGKEPGFCN